MATRKMTHDKVSGRYYFAETVSSGIFSDPVLAPPAYPHDPGSKPVSVFVKPAGTARLEFTLSSRSLVEAGTAIWLPWPNGDVTAATAAAINAPVTAMRCVSVSGACDWGMMI